MSLTNDPILAAAAGFEPGIVSTLAAQDAALQGIPEFSVEFKSAPFPGFDGPVVVRYGDVSDSLTIERLMGPSGLFVAEAVASLQVLISKAPASWYQLPTGATNPILNLGRIPDIEGLLDIYRSYSKWRADFRSKRSED